MRVVSLVPSWTETFIEAGVQVVGRTRYCIHPAPIVEKITIVGGTKQVDWKKIIDLQPDLVIMDKEENTLEMATECPVAWQATHVRAMSDMPMELENLSVRLQSDRLKDLSQRWKQLMDREKRETRTEEPPGLVTWVRKPEDLGKKNTVIYTIWANPWMAAGPETFIGSVMSWCGWPVWGSAKYPQFSLEQFKDSSPLFLCSTEPFPFAQRQEILQKLPGAVALVDGEKLSWFGIRTLRYLESVDKSSM